MAHNSGGHTTNKSGGQPSMKTLSPCSSEQDHYLLPQLTLAGNILIDTTGAVFPWSSGMNVLCPP